MDSTSQLVFYGLHRRFFGFKKQGVCYLKNWVAFQRYTAYSYGDVFYGREKVFLGHKIEDYKNMLMQYQAISYNIHALAERAQDTLDILRTDQRLYYSDWYGYFSFEFDPFDSVDLRGDPTVSKRCRLR